MLKLKEGYEMKIKFILMLLALLGLSVVGCSDEEKVVDKKKESVVDIKKEEVASSKSTREIEWFFPTNSQLKWEKAKELCENNSGRLPTIEELKKVVVDCGGIVTKVSKEGLKIINQNRANKVYQSCYESRGFGSHSYWSSTRYAGNIYDAWYIDFDSGTKNGSFKYTKVYIGCVRAGE